jgi:hypothetical protein
VLQAKPFKPVRLFLTDGSTLDIPHPDLCFLLRRTAIIGYPAEQDEGGEGDRYSIVDLSHVGRLDTSGTPNLTESRSEE